MKDDLRNIGFENMEGQKKTILSRGMECVLILAKVEIMEDEGQVSYLS